MPIDDQELIGALRSAVDAETDGLRYDRPLPEVRTRGGSGPALVLAAAASVAAVATGVALLATNDPTQRPVADPPASPASRWVANDDSALGGAITDPGRLRTVVPDPGTPSAGTPDICLLPAGDATSCGDSVQPPYPLLIEVDAEVPASARPFPRLTGHEGEVLEGWIGQDPAYGGLVWLRYPDATIRISAAYYETGRELADYLLEHPVEP